MKIINYLVSALSVAVSNASTVYGSNAFFKSILIIIVLWWASWFSPVHMITGPEYVEKGARLYFHTEMFKGLSIVNEKAVLPAPILDVLKG